MLGASRPTKINSVFAMHFVRKGLLFVFMGTAGLFSTEAFPQSTTSASSAFQPEISASTALVGGYTTRSSHEAAPGSLENGMTMQEIEIRLSANSDPYFRYDLALTGHDHDGVMEVGFEEAFISTLAIPDTTVRAGKFLINFGKANLHHIHNRPFIDAPLPLGHVFGANHLLGTGFSVDYLAPLPFFTELNLQMVQANWTGDAHAHGAEATSTDEHANEAHRFTYLSHLKTFFDLNDSLSLEAGGSGLLNTDDHGHWQKTFGADLTFKWVPTDAARYTSFEWTNEYMSFQSEELKKDGFYSGIRYQTAQQWRFQVRGALLDIATDAETRRTRASTLIAFAPSERTAIRLQYAFEDSIGSHHEEDPAGTSHEGHGEEPVHEVFLQFIVAIGSHPAHAY